MIKLPSWAHFNVKMWLGMKETGRKSYCPFSYGSMNCGQYGDTSYKRHTKYCRAFFPELVIPDDNCYGACYFCPCKQLGVEAVTVRVRLYLEGILGI